MKYFVDANVFLEVLLVQEKAMIARQFLARIGEDEFFVSDFSIHTIGVILFQRKRFDVFRQFIEDMIIDTGFNVISVSEEENDALIAVARQFNLDFDDAYQYVAAEKYDLTLVSFDGDFDRTPRGRKTPEEILGG